MTSIQNTITELNSLNDWYDEISSGCEDFYNTPGWSNYWQAFEYAEPDDEDQEDALLIRFLNGLARRIQSSWANRQPETMACPCPEMP